MAGEQAGGNNPRHEAENPQEFDWNKFGEVPVKYVAQAIAELRQADPAIGAIDWADLYGERVSSDVAAKIQAKAEEIRANENSSAQGQESPAQEQAPADTSEGDSSESGEQAAQQEGGAERRRNVSLWRRIGVRVLAVAAAVGIAIGGIGAAFGVGPAGRLKKLRENGTRTEMSAGDATDGMAMGIDEALDEYSQEIRSDALSDANLDAIIAEAAEGNESFTVADDYRGLYADAETGTKPNPEKSNPVNFVAPIEYKESGDYRDDIDRNVRNMAPVLAAYYEKLDDKDKLPELVGKSCADLQTMMAEDPSVHQKIYEHFMSEMESTENGTVDGRCYNEYMVTSASDGETINSKNSRVVFCETIEDNTRVIVVHFKNGSELKIKLNCGQAVIEIEETNEGILISYYETKEELPEDEQPSNSVKKRFIPKDVFEGTDTIEWPDTGPGPVTEDPDKDEEEKEEELDEKKDLDPGKTFEGTDTTGWPDETGPGSAEDVTEEPDAMEGIDEDGRPKGDGGQSTEATEDPSLEGDNSESSNHDGGGSSESSDHDDDDGGHDSGGSESSSSESGSHDDGGSSESSSHDDGGSSESHEPASQEHANDESRSSEGQQRAEQEKSDSDQRHEDSQKSEQAAQSVEKQSDNAIEEHTDSSGKTDVDALLDMD